VAADASVDFDGGDVKGMFYDDLCCAKGDDPVTNGVDQCTTPDMRPTPDGPVPCCADLECRRVAGVGKRCLPPLAECSEEGEACTELILCCEGLRCAIDGPVGTCEVPCGEPAIGSEPGDACGQDSDCCFSDITPPMTECVDNECRYVGQ
jgi:hypothetical protein